MYGVIIEGLLESLSITNLILIFLSTFIGVIIGALPGLGPTIGIALLIPISYGMETTTALLLSAGIYVGAVYGGSITAIVLGIPGTPTSTATVLDGFPMSQQGRSLEALAASTVSSSFGGFVSALFLMFFTPMLSRVVLKFGVAEQFMLAMFGLSVIAVSSRESFFKGLLGGFFGLAIATVGYDPITGYNRFNFGVDYLADGFPFMVVVIGLFGISQTISMAEKAQTISGSTELSGSIWTGTVKVFKNMRVLIQSTLIGSFMGGMPGVGGGPANMIAYTTVANSSKDRDSFGKGNIKGVIAAEASNNATVGTALIPTLAFGIPGSTVAAVLLGLLMLHGVEPGPKMFIEMPLTIYTFFWGLLFTNLILVLVCFPLLKYFAKITIVPYQILVPNIFMLCVLGTYGMRGYVFDVFVGIAFGVLGYFLKKANYPMVCIVLGLVLGRLAESNLSRSLMIHRNLDFLYKRPITLTLLILTAVIMIIPYINIEKIKRRLRKN
jgi:putative tricarboxylic transport membrane protein